MAIIDKLAGVTERFPGGGVLLTTMEFFINWGRKNSLWPLTFGLSCCAIEMFSTGASRFDWARLGNEVLRASPRQADMMVVAGTVCWKMAPRIKRLYEQMGEPRYVIAMGACAVSGGPFYYNSYGTVRGVDQLIPVDIYLPGCPPKPEALLDAVLKLEKKITRERLPGRRVNS
ncbi:NADH-quinone oxidoreductase subunit B [bacterium]|nr:NADH-quinone oxidoreductase subunit B [bacterium]